MSPVLLSNPPWWAVDAAGKHILGGVRSGAPRPVLAPVRSTPDHFVYGNYVPFPHRLGEAAAALSQMPGNPVVHLRDSIALRESYESYFLHVQGLRPGLVVLESAPLCLEHDTRVARQLRRNLPRARLVFCGPFSPEQAVRLLASPFPVDAVVTGAYDDGLRQVIAGSVGHVLGRHPDEAELDALPLPACDEAAALHYCDPVPHAESQLSLPCYPHLHIDLSRDTGSARRCRRPLSAIDRQLDARLRLHPFRGVYFDDSGLSADADHLDQLCRLMLPRRTHWSLLLRPGLPGPDPWLALRQSGCHGIRFAITHPDDVAAFAADAASVKALGMSAHAALVRPLPDKPAVLRALSAMHVCNSIQDLVPDTLVVERIERRTLVVESAPDTLLSPCAS